MDGNFKGVRVEAHQGYGSLNVTKVHNWVNHQNWTAFLPWEQASCFSLWLWLSRVFARLGSESEVIRNDE